MKVERERLAGLILSQPTVCAWCRCEYNKHTGLQLRKLSDEEYSKIVSHGVCKGCGEKISKDAEHDIIMEDVKTLAMENDFEVGILGQKWQVGLRKGSEIYNPNTIYVDDGSEYPDAVAIVFGIPIHGTLDRFEHDDRWAQGLAIAEEIVRLHNEGLSHG